MSMLKIDLEEKLNEFLDDMMNLNDLPGLAVGVSIGGISDETAELPESFSSCITDFNNDANSSDNPPDEPFEFLGVRGYRDYARQSPLKCNDIFHCASVSKLFTATAVMKLVEAGVFSLYDRLCSILPSLKIKDHRFSEIRLWNMLTHTSGLGDVNDYHWNKFETDQESLRRYVYGISESGTEEVTDQSMLWHPRNSPEFYGVPETDENGNPLVDENGKAVNLFRYSNIAFEILGQIVAEYSDRIHIADFTESPENTSNREESADGKLSYEEFISEYLFKPAGMNFSTMKTFERCDFNSSEEREKNNMASPHEKNASRETAAVKFYPYTRYHSPSSTLTSNLSDLLKWGRAHLRSFCAADSAGAAGSVKRMSSVYSANSPGYVEYADSTDSKFKINSHNCSTCNKKLSEPILQRDTYDSIWRNYATVPNNGEKMGLGWFIRNQKINEKKYTLYGHEGTDDGFRASFWICPELELVTVVLSNLSGAPVKRINRKLFEYYCSFLPRI